MSKCLTWAGRDVRDGVMRQSQGHAEPFQLFLYSNSCKGHKQKANTARQKADRQLGKLLSHCLSERNWPGPRVMVG